ncbi:cupin domain-containing protein [Aquimarina sp. 2201CG5-10]|uniref:cupin domain-containing protein n=1 Tax=Aquimarina callyspongiae TaxID=3098150 RepID=UPI002AB526F7|nr:cupin domain-containing protein [Aquimarina sp. 2201CG5-10]MDY8134041.1 cupin domain-containing protein [Aquimarina sp. 2201CG5-10]
MNITVKEIVDKLKLSPHPEGGYYKEIYRSNEVIPQETLGAKFTGDRNYCTGIYFLLTSENFSAFHRIKQDEIWHYYGGSSLYVHVIDLNGKYMRHAVGMNLDQGEVPQLTVPAGCWFASSVKNENDYSLVGCTVSPGFDFDDFELAESKELIVQFPDHKDLIKQYTRD